MKKGKIGWVIMEIQECYPCLVQVTPVLENKEQCAKIWIQQMKRRWSEEYSDLDLEQKGKMMLRTGSVEVNGHSFYLMDLEQAAGNS